jgi:alpha-ketoglutarate-dependent taurine dioxygenase
MKTTAKDIVCRIDGDPGEKLAACEREKIVTLLRRHGCIQFTGFAPTMEEFEEFTCRFGTCQETRIVHYPPGGVALGFHSEDAYNPFRPDALWLWCCSSGSEGGAPTGVVDGVRLLASLSDGWRHFCRSNQLRFARQWSAATWREKARSREELERVLRAIPKIVYQFSSDATLYIHYDSPFVTHTPSGEDSFSNTLLHALTEPPFYGMSLIDGSPIPGELISVVEKYALANEVCVGGQTGDVVLIDNHRMMHRRGEYGGTGRDMRARHCENLYGSLHPEMNSPLAAWTKRLLQGDEAYPVRVGPLDSMRSDPNSPATQAN